MTSTWTRKLAGLAAGVAFGALATSQAFAEDIKIGMVVTLSGPPAALGQQLVDGFQLALEQNGGQLGGQSVDLIVEDDELKPDVALLKAKALIERDDVDFVVGTVFSNMLQAIFKPVVQSETFLISPNAGPSTFAGRNCNPYFFVTSYQNNQPAEVSGMIASEEGFENVFTMVPNYQAGRDNIEGFKKTFKGNVTDEVFTPLGHQDFSAELARIATSGSDAIFTFMPGGMGVNLVKQYDQAGLKGEVPFLSAFTVDETTLPATKDTAVGMLAGAQWAPDLDNEANKAFVAAFEKEYGYAPSVYAAQGYDAAQLIDGALKEAGGKADKAKLMEAMKAAPFDSVRGDFSFNTNHFPIQDVYVVKAVKRDDGKYVTSAMEKVFDDKVDAYVGECRMK